MEISGLVFLNQFTRRVVEGALFAGSIHMGVKIDIGKFNRWCTYESNLRDQKLLDFRRIESLFGRDTISFLVDWGKICLIPSIWCRLTNFVTC